MEIQARDAAVIATTAVAMTSSTACSGVRRAHESRSVCSTASSALPVGCKSAGAAYSAPRIRCRSLHVTRRTRASRETISERHTIVSTLRLVPRTRMICPSQDSV